MRPALWKCERGGRLGLLKIGLLFIIVMLAASPGWRGSFVWDDLGVVQNSEFQALPVSDFAREVMRVAGALICFLASLMSKETTIPVIAALPVLTLVVATEHRRRRFVEMAGAAWGALLVYMVVRAIVGIPLPSGLVLQTLSTTGYVEAQALYHYLIHLAWPAGVLAREPVGLSHVSYPAGVLVAASLLSLLWIAAAIVAVRLRPRLAGVSLFCALEEVRAGVSPHLDLPAAGDNQ